jgi:hypothetical protein
MNSLKNFVRFFCFSHEKESEIGENNFPNLSIYELKCKYDIILLEVLLLFCWFVCKLIVKTPTHYKTHTNTHYKTHTYTHPHITKHTHTHTHTSQKTLTHYKTLTYTHPHFEEQKLNKKMRNGFRSRDTSPIQNVI